MEPAVVDLSERRERRDGEVDETSVGARHSSAEQSQAADVLAFLRTLETVRSLSDEALATIARCAERADLPIDAVMAEQGAEPDGILIVRSGHASVLRSIDGAVWRSGTDVATHALHARRRSPSSPPLVLRVDQASPARVFGARALARGAQHFASLVCDTPCSVLRIRAGALSGMHEEAAAALLAADQPLPTDSTLLKLLELDTSWERFRVRFRNAVIAEQRSARSAPSRAGTGPAHPRCLPDFPPHALRPSIGGLQRETSRTLGELEAAAERAAELLAERVARACEDESMQRDFPRRLKTIATLVAEAQLPEGWARAALPETRTFDMSARLSARRRDVSGAAPA
ncbi:hypothetical protein KFE25_006791 [Diacronema lutheri]|uniref:Cyclic nucleotide-binding domain-containing protein n=1 Tax=Diacronema lutheri TaxID=2081491 RepID=A0A8J6CCN2_DIALT|nr:hypothetical protein KFE25_006791 [Diacronema lutheri]